MTDSTVLVSVLMPAPDDRDQLYHAIESFLNQTLAASRVEMLVGSDGSRPDIDQMLLREFPAIRIICRPGANFDALINACAEEATGRYLYMTESHCIAEPDCLEQAVLWVERKGMHGACSDSDGINRNAVARGEQRLFDDDIQKWRASGVGKVAVRGMLIDRATWLRAGGLRAEFGHFAEVMLSKVFKKSGVRIGYADTSVVHHTNQTTFRGLMHELEEYGRDEARCWHRASPTVAAFDFDPWQDLVKTVRDVRGARAKLRMANRRLWTCRGIFWTTALVPETRQRAFARHWATAIEIGRLRYFAEWLANENSTPVTETTRRAA